MLLTHCYSNLETLTPGIDTVPANINPGGPVPIAFSDTPWPGGTTMDISGLQWAAGLSKRAVTVLADLLASITQITFSYQIRPSQLAAVLSQANENDLMVTNAKGALFNGSVRKNNQTGGMWQVVNSAGAWVDSGFKPGLFVADVWTQVTVVYAINWTTGIRVVSITDNGTTFQLDTPPAAPDIVEPAWGPNLLDWQSQETLLATGSYCRDMRNVGLICQ